MGIYDAHGFIARQRHYNLEMIETSSWWKILQTGNK